MSDTFSPKLAHILGETLHTEYQKKCLEHALSITSIIVSLGEIESDTYILDADMADCAFRTSEVLLLSSDTIWALGGVGRDEIIANATLCLRFIDSMVSMYPTVAAMVSQAFGRTNVD
jgi:hypothetical protein